MDLQEIFLQRSPENILVYGISNLFFDRLRKYINLKKINYREVAKIFGLNDKKPEKNLWAWRISFSKFVDNENSYRFQIIRKDSIKLYSNIIGFRYPTKLNKLNSLLKLQTEILLPQ